MRVSLSKVTRHLYNAGLANTGGNISVRLCDYIIITPSGAADTYWGRVSPDNLSTVDMTGKRLDGPPPSRETNVHLIIYNRFREVLGIIHAHPPHLLSLSEKLACWRPLTYSARNFGELLMCHCDPASQSLEVAIDNHLSSQDVRDRMICKYGVAIFIPRHGLFVGAKHVTSALYFLNKIEENARLITASLGR